MIFIRMKLQRMKLQYNRQSLEKVLVQRAVETTILKLYDKCLLDKYANADGILKDFFCFLQNIEVI